MTTLVVELTEATQSLAEYAQHLDDGTIVITQNGLPIAAIVALPNTDSETISLSQSHDFLSLIERSRTRYVEEGGITNVDMRRRFAQPSEEE